MPPKTKTPKEHGQRRAPDKTNAERANRPEPNPKPEARREQKKTPEGAKR